MALLRVSRLPLSEISEQLGFEDPRSLRRNVRLRFGKTPTEIRKSLAA